MLFDTDGFPIISLDDFLCVAAKIRLVSLDHQPNRKHMIESLGIGSADKYVFEKILNNSLPTLKDFLLTRAASAPTQTLPLIISYLSTSELYKIDLPNLVTNLMHYALQDELSVYDLSDIMYWYTALNHFNKKINNAKLEFISCVDSNGNFLPEFSKLFMNAVRIKLPSRTNLQLSQQAIKITFEQNYALFRENIDAMSRVGLMYNNFNYDIVYIFPISIQARIYQHPASINKIPMYPLPVLCCYDFEILERFTCSSELNYFRPITFATYLNPKIKSLFYGARAIDDCKVATRFDKNEDLVYDRYDTISAKPGLLDMYKMHTLVSNPFGTINHDCGHIRLSSFQDMSLRNRVIKIINLILQDNILQKSLNDIELQAFLYIKRVILDIGIYNLFTATFNAGNIAEYKAALEKAINSTLLRLDDADRSKALQEAQLYCTVLLPNIADVVKNILDTKYIFDILPEIKNLSDQLITTIETIWLAGSCSKENIEEIIAFAAQRNLNFIDPMSFIQFVHLILVKKKIQLDTSNSQQRLTI
jgi:hypothetical protein